MRLLRRFAPRNDMLHYPAQSTPKTKLISLHRHCEEQSDEATLTSFQNYRSQIVYFFQFLLYLRPHKLQDL